MKRVHNQKRPWCRSAENDHVPNQYSADENNKKAIESFPGSAFNLFSTKIVEPYTSFTEHQQNPVWEYVVHEMTYSFCPTGVSLHHLKLMRGAPVMNIRKVFHPINVNEKMFVVKVHFRKVVHVAAVRLIWSGAGKVFAT